MPMRGWLFAWLALAVFPIHAEATLFSKTSLPKYEHPKTEWEHWRNTKVGDSVEYHDQNGKLWSRFECLEVGDHSLLIRSSTPNPFGADKPPVTREHRHLFVEGAPGDVRGTFSEATLEIDGEAKPIRKETFSAGGKLIREYYYLADAPFDGMVRNEQYVPSSNRLTITGTFKSGGAQPTEEPESPPSTTPNPDPVDATNPPKDEPPEEPKAEENFRTWTSRDGRFKVDASLLKMEKGIAYLKRADNGKVVEVQLQQLSRKDQRIARGLE